MAKSTSIGRPGGRGGGGGMGGRGLATGGVGDGAGGNGRGPRGVTGTRTHPASPIRMAKVKSGYEIRAVMRRIWRRLPGRDNRKTARSKKNFPAQLGRGKILAMQTGGVSP